MDRWLAAVLFNRLEPRCRAPNMRSSALEAPAAAAAAAVVAEDAVAAVVGGPGAAWRGFAVDLRCRCDV